MARFVRQSHDRSAPARWRFSAQYARDKVLPKPQYHFHWWQSGVRFVCIGPVAPTAVGSFPCRVLSLGGCFVPSRHSSDGETSIEYARPALPQGASALADPRELTIARSRMSLDDPPRFPRRGVFTKVGGCYRVHSESRRLRRYQ